MAKSNYVQQMRRAAKAVAEHATLGQAAEALGIDLSTLESWMEEPAFASELEWVVSHDNALTSLQLLRLRKSAVRVLSRGLSGNRVSRTHLAAARVVLDHTAKVDISGAMKRLRPENERDSMCRMWADMCMGTVEKAQRMNIDPPPEFALAYDAVKALWNRSHGARRAKEGNEEEPDV